MFVSFVRVWEGVIAFENKEWTIVRSEIKEKKNNKTTESLNKQTNKRIKKTKCRGVDCQSVAFCK